MFPYTTPKVFSNRSPDEPETSLERPDSQKTVPRKLPLRFSNMVPKAPQNDPGILPKPTSKLPRNGPYSFQTRPQHFPKATPSSHRQRYQGILQSSAPECEANSVAKAPGLAATGRPRRGQSALQDPQGAIRGVRLGLWVLPRFHLALAGRVAKPCTRFPVALPLESMFCNYARLCER